jgi:hypothetical protein
MRNRACALTAAAVCALASGTGSAAAGSAPASALPQTSGLSAVRTAGPTAAGAVWGPAQAIPERGKVDSFAAPNVLTCPATGDCVAAGADIFSQIFKVTGVVAQERHGTWGSAATLPKLNAIAKGLPIQFNSISCGAPGDCAAVGEYAPGFDGDHPAATPFILTEHRGIWGSSVDPADTLALNVGFEGQAMSVSCPSAGNCAAGGYYTTQNPHFGPPRGYAFLASEKHGVWGKAKPVAGITITANTWAWVTTVSCWAAGDCEAGGFTGTYSSGSLPFNEGGKGWVAAETNGTWHPARVISGMSAIGWLSCPAAGDCVAAGYGSVQNQCSINFGCPAAYVTEKKGTWGSWHPVLPASELLTTKSTVSALSCGSPGNCVAGGSFGLLEEKDNTWGKPRFVPGTTGGTGVTSLSCPAAGYCEAGGGYGTSKGFLISESHGSWGKLRVVSYGAIGPISCYTPTSCAALVATRVEPILVTFAYEAVMTKAVVQATRTTLTLSAGTATYAHEQAEHVSARVSAGLGTPYGIVLVSDGPATICVIGLIGGRGSCALKPGALGAGAHVLTAYYLAQALFRQSVSPGHAITVLKDHTATNLTLSSDSVKYGNERSERLTATVRAEYGGPPGGNVVVTAGSVTVCVIRLTHGTGSCLLTARELAPGGYQLIARFRGNANLTASASAKRPLSITK